MTGVIKHVIKQKQDPVDKTKKMKFFFVLLVNLEILWQKEIMLNRSIFFLTSEAKVFSQFDSKLFDNLAFFIGQVIFQKCL
jgi:hypothetical protein